MLPCIEDLAELMQIPEIVEMRASLGYSYLVMGSYGRVCRRI